MLIIALVLAAVGLAALVFAVVTSNALVAWVCIGASVLGVLLLIVDALRDRRRQKAPAKASDEDEDEGEAEDEDEHDDEAGPVGEEIAARADEAEVGSDDEAGFDDEDDLVEGDLDDGDLDDDDLDDAGLDSDDLGGGERAE